MKTRITLLWLTLSFMLPILGFTGNRLFAQSVSGNPSTTGCSNGGIITASSEELGATPEYQLVKDGIVLAPSIGDRSRFAPSTGTLQFEGLADGTYVLRGRKESGQRVYVSSEIIVSSGYVNMVASSARVAANCLTNTGTVSIELSGGQGPYTYKIAPKTSPGNTLQTSAATADPSFLFDPLAVGDYIISIVDACGVTTTSAAAVAASSTSRPSDVKLGENAYFTRLEGACDSPLYLGNERGFVYVQTGNALSIDDKKKFTWKLRFNNQLYGQGIQVGAPGYSMDELLVPIPSNSGIDREAILNCNDAAIVIMDDCGNQQAYSIININQKYSYFQGVNCGNTGSIIAWRYAGLSCFPMDVTFTNQYPPYDIVTKKLTNLGGEEISGFRPGGRYKVAYEDDAGYTTGLWNNWGFVDISNSSTFNPIQTYRTGLPDANLNAIGFGYVRINKQADPLNTKYSFQILSGPVGTEGKILSDITQSGEFILMPSLREGDPEYSWPKGNYRVRVTSSCGSRDVDVVVKGFIATVNNYTVTPVCGGFNYVMKGTFDDPSAYEVIIISGPSGRGQTIGLANATESLPFTSLPYGTYVFGLRIKGGTEPVFTQTVTFGTDKAIVVDKSKTGGYVCAEGASDGVLTITASSLSPAPNDNLLYAISPDGGATFGNYQISNQFTGLAAGIYTFKVKDGCGNEVTEKIQILNAAKAKATADGATDPIFCKNLSGGIEIYLDMDLIGARYEWSGPGITEESKNLKSPVIKYGDLALGDNLYSCILTLNAPCNTLSVTNLKITTTEAVLKITDPAEACYPETVDITAAAIVDGSTPNLTYTFFRKDELGDFVELENPDKISASGTYYIGGKNTESCEQIKPVKVVINALPIAKISYQNSSFCNRGTATVTQTGQIGGVYSGDAGLVINSETGNIDLELSTVGSHTVTYTFKNDKECSNTAKATIIINQTMLPTALADVKGECEATAVAPVLTDSCAGIITATTETIFPVITQGTTIVTWTFDYGNRYTKTVTQNVIVKDVTNPVLPLLNDLTAECSVTPTTPIAADNCSGDITGTTTTVFPITKQGTTVVTWTFDDGNGNVITADQDVIIKDVTKPVIPILADVNEECSASLIAPTTTDNCAGIITGTTTTIFPITKQGTTVVTWTFDDGNGNVVTANQNVIVKNITKPVAPILLDVKGECSATPEIPTAIDTCGGIITGTTKTIFPITKQGTTVVTWTFDDGNGNISQANQNVIIKDITKPIVPILSDVKAECSATPEVPTATDNCSGTIIGTTETVFPITTQGTTVITWTFNDGNGNIATANQNVIIRDITAPVFVETLPEAIIYANCEDVIPSPVTLTATDNCGAAVVNFTETRVEGDCSAKYDLVRTWTAIDESGNENKFTQILHMSCLPEIYNAITPNGDGINDTFKIYGIDCFQNNHISIYNRNGVLVYEKQGYDNITNPFEGFSNGRATVKKGDKLPTGTYFYILEYDNNSSRIKKSGYLYVNNQ